MLHEDERTDGPLVLCTEGSIEGNDENFNLGVE